MKGARQHVLENAKMGPLLPLLIALLAATTRGLIAKAAALGLEPWLADRFPALPHWACAGFALILMVVAIELLALLVERLIDHWGRRE
jgi:hypothetical protein